MREFGYGVSLLFRGFSWWRKRPALMASGLIPAALVAALMLAGLVSLGFSLPSLTEALTPFADSWGVWATVLRVAIGTAFVGAALVLLAISFTALTLIIGEPFYDRIWRQVETDVAGSVPAESTGFWRGVRDGLSLLARGIGISLIAAALALIPAVGSVIGTIVGVCLTGWLLADELSSRALAAAGIPAKERRALLTARRARTLGFGVATQLCFLVPLGAVASMPAAVAGSTLLAHSVLRDRRIKPVT